MPSKSPYNSGLLWRSGIRYHFRRPWLYVLSVVGIALGVAVVISIDLANSSAEKAFRMSAESVTGAATHQIYGAGSRLDEEVYRTLRTETGFRKSAPVVEGHASTTDPIRSFQVLGIDPLAEEPFRSFSSQQAGIDLSTFMSGQITGFLSETTAEALQVAPGDTLDLTAGGNHFPMQIAGLIQPEDEYSRQALENLIIVDISTAQKLFGMDEYLSRIDLILPEDGTGLPEHITRALSESSPTQAGSATDPARLLEASLPDGVSVVRSGSRTETVAQMTRAFELNLQALSMLALLVGMFLIYNTITFTVVQRRPLIGRLRALGATRGEIQRMILGEALFIGIPGTILGMTGGILLAQFLLQYVTQTINDLYFVVSVQQVTIAPLTLIKGFFLGIGATLLASLWPAREASRAPVRIVLQRSEKDARLRRNTPVLSLIGLLFIMMGIGFLFLPGETIISGYVSLLHIIIGFSLLTPLLITMMASLLRPVAGLLFGLPGKMAVRGVVTDLGRTSVATSALVIAVAAAIGVGLMVDSFRVTVDSWLESQLQADIYIQSPGFSTRGLDSGLDPELIALLRNAPGVSGSHSVQRTEIQTNQGLDRLTVVETDREAVQSYNFRERSPGLWDRFDNEPVILATESYAFNNDVSVGDTITINTDRGEHNFAIAGIYYDYSSDTGLLTMSRTVYDRFFDSKVISGLALYTDADTDIETLIPDLRERSAGIQNVIIQSNQGLREASMEIFDRTFTVTIVMRFLAVLVAFIGVLSALMALQFERSREMAVLRANGLTPGQLWGLVTGQTGVIGFMAGLLSIPLGIVMAAILVYVINLRSFGWTLQFQITPEMLIQAMLVAVTAAILAGLYPSWKITQTNPADALRDE